MSYLGDSIPDSVIAVASINVVDELYILFP